MDQGGTLSSAQYATERPEAPREAAESQDTSGGNAALEGVRAGQREATKVLPPARRRLAGDIGQYARARPVPALVIAAGLGFLIGRRVMSRRSAVAPREAAGTRWPARSPSSRFSESSIPFPPRQP
jgi:ElaB/YqjD/DUF883 family membrane-anchored ribosome-binding protein